MSRILSPGILGKLLRADRQAVKQATYLRACAIEAGVVLLCFGLTWPQPLFGVTLYIAFSVLSQVRALLATPHRRTRRVEA